jgi:CopG family nickel-responsive transcriptional regulator
MEATVLKGKSAQVQAVANQIISERGVRHGRLIMIPAELEAEMHDHDGETPHSHIKIK